MSTPIHTKHLSRDLMEAVDGSLYADGKIVSYPDLIEKLVIHITKHEQKVFDHAFDLGRNYEQKKAREGN